MFLLEFAYLLLRVLELLALNWASLSVLLNYGVISGRNCAHLMLLLHFVMRHAGITCRA
jgi:hypothetical protein